MLDWQYIILWLGLITSTLIFVRSFFESSRKNNQFQETPWLLPWGIFVWADGLIFAPFWLGVFVVCLLLNDWKLFLLIYSVFWAVRSLGETVYWLNEQFAVNHRNEPKNLRGYSLVKNDSVWFLYQIAWQCVTVISIIFSIYFGVMWGRSI